MTLLYKIKIRDCVLSELLFASGGSTAMDDLGLTMFNETYDAVAVAGWKADDR